MELTKSILEKVREGVGLSANTPDFDTDLLIHINNAIGTLNQNGVGNFIVVEDITTTWGDLQDPTQIEGNKYFQMVPSFITLSVKILFDPPPPSAVQFFQNNIDQTLWRLKIAYEQSYTTTTTVYE